ncbi:MAG: hypothetical protein RR347_06525, partial [Anaerovoracaceae bacterium]
SWDSNYNLPIQMCNDQKCGLQAKLIIIITYGCNLGPKKINIEFAHRITKKRVPVSRFPDTNGFQGINCHNYKRMLPQEN